MKNNEYWNGPINRTPDFENFLKVLRREKTADPVLFEFYTNWDLQSYILGKDLMDELEGQQHKFIKRNIQAFYKTGYDYATAMCPNFSFPTGEKDKKASASANDGAVIVDEESFENYLWPDPDQADLSYLELSNEVLPEGMKIITAGPGGILENATTLVGFENLCYMLVDEEELAEQIFNNIGKRLVRYYELCCQYDSVGAIISNDDWGFKTQTMLAPDNMRHLVFPWHKKIVETAHTAGRPAILHSCGKLDAVYDDLIDGMGFDGKHSYEDTIQPVEEAYEQYHSRIAIMGGIDMHFICTATPEEVYKRSCDMLDRTKDRGGYALGSGNSIPEYVPMENYFAMIAALNNRRG